MAIAVLAFGYLTRLVPETFPASTRLGLDWRVLAFACALGLLTVLLFGARNALVVPEITLTVVLLAAAGLLLRSHAELLAADHGFRPENLLLAETVLPQGKYAESAARNSFYQRVLERSKPCRASKPRPMRTFRR